MTVAQEKKTGQGTTYSYAGSLVGQVKSITLPAKTIPEIEVTDLDSTIAAFIAGKPLDVGSLKIEFYHTPGATADETLDTAANAYTIGAHVIVFASLTTQKTATFSGFFTDLTPGIVDGKNPLTRTATVRLTTVITWT